MTGHQEYNPVYISPGNIYNTARRGHGIGVLPVAFLPIPKGNDYITCKCFKFLYLYIYTVSNAQRESPEFQQFSRQLYHKCLEIIFSPLRPYMESPKVVRCPDGHFRKAIFSLGPYIADYPEQVWLAGVVSNWCPK